MNFYKLFLISGIAFLFLNGQSIYAQVTTVSADTITTQSVISDTLAPHSPKKAAIMSALVPGLGQIYNKKYWKLPIVYGGLIGLGYGVQSTQKLYKEFRLEYIQRIKGEPEINPKNSIYSPEQLTIIRDDYRKTRDLLVIGTMGFYLLQIIDATVDAHLFNFDVSDDLSIDIRPDIYTCYNTQRSFPALSLRIKL